MHEYIQDPREEPPGRGRIDLARRLASLSREVVHINEFSHCPHGAAVGSACPQCSDTAKSEQIAWQGRIPQLLKKSAVKYTREASAETALVSHEGGPSYTIEIVDSEDDETINTVHSYLSSVFDPEELDDFDTLKGSLKGKTPYGTSSQSKSRIFVVRAEDTREVLSTLVIGNMDLRDEQGNLTGETSVLRGYSYTREDVRSKGFSRELHISALIDAATMAQQQRKALRFAGSEAVGTGVPVWNTVGLLGVYREPVTQPGVLEELQYMQPALKFDAGTGGVDIAVSANDFPEHLLIDGFGQDLSSRDVMQLTDAYFRWNNIKPRVAFSNDMAYAQHKQHILGKYRDISTFFDGAAHVHFLTKADALAREQDGYTVIEHRAANHK